MLYNILMIVLINTLFTFVIYNLMGKEGIFFDKLWKRVIALIPPFALGFLFAFGVYEILKSFLKFLLDYFRE